MSDFLLSYGVVSYISQNILIVPFQADFYVEVIEALRLEILQQLHLNPAIKGLIIDLSKVDIVDVQNMKSLEKSLHMATILGVTGFLVGINPSVTLALVALGYEPGQLKTALSIERATLFISQVITSQDMLNEELSACCDDEVLQIDDIETRDEY